MVPGAETALPSPPVRAPSSIGPGPDAPLDLAAFRRALTDRIAASVRALRARIGSETLYAFVLYTSGEAGYAWVEASANTEDGLARAAAARAAARYSREAYLARTRAACDRLPRATGHG
jgi:hypothetical protein